MSDKKSQTISVCIATYNGASFIEEQIDSILSQLKAGDEVIISDDSSTDDTIKILKAYQDERIKIFENQKFKNPIFNFENAISASKGEIIVLADQDDVWKNNRIERLLKIFDGGRNMMVFSNGELVDEHLQLMNRTLFDHYNVSTNVVRNIIVNSYVGCCISFSSEVKKVILPFPKNIPSHDQWIGILSKVFYKVELDFEPQIYHRRHRNNYSYTGEKSKFSILKKLSFRFALLSSLVKRMAKQWLS